MPVSNYIVRSYVTQQATSNNRPGQEYIAQPYTCQRMHSHTIKPECLVFGISSFPLLVLAPLAYMSMSIATGVGAQELVVPLT